MVSRFNSEIFVTKSDKNSAMKQSDLSSPSQTKISRSVVKLTTHPIIYNRHDVLRTRIVLVILEVARAAQHTPEENGNPVAIVTRIVAVPLSAEAGRRGSLEETPPPSRDDVSEGFTQSCLCDILVSSYSDSLQIPAKTNEM